MSRFLLENETVTDKQTGLMWIKNASIFDFPLSWDEALHTVIELDSLTDMGQHSPALSAGPSFNNVREFYWSSTTSMYDINYVWVLYMIDGAVGVGHKPLSEFYLWPVRGKERMVIR